MTLDLSAKNNSQTLFIEEIEPLVYQSSNVASNYVVTDEAGGCGDPYERTFDMVLARSSGDIRDLGISGESPTPPDPQVRTGKLGASFTVAADDPARIVVNVRTCDMYYEFGLRIHYSTGGEQYVFDVGSPEAPYRIDGASGGRYFSQDFTTGLRPRSESDKLFPQC